MKFIKQYNNFINEIYDYAHENFNHYEQYNIYFNEVVQDKNGNNVINEFVYYVIFRYYNDSYSNTYVTISFGQLSVNDKDSESYKQAIFRKNGGEFKDVNIFLNKEIYPDILPNNTIELIRTIEYIINEFIENIFLKDENILAIGAVRHYISQRDINLFNHINTQDRNFKNYETRYSKFNVLYQKILEKIANKYNLSFMINLFKSKSENFTGNRYIIYKNTNDKNSIIDLINKFNE
jgi:hypothetical protein